jgi:hypothetical protein
MATRTVSTVLSLGLCAFFAFCGQAHVTSRFTPAFTQMLQDSLPELNRNAFPLLHVTSDEWGHVFTAINVDDSIARQVIDGSVCLW